MIGPVARLGEVETLVSRVLIGLGIRYARRWLMGKPGHFRGQSSQGEVHTLVLLVCNVI